MTDNGKPTDDQAWNSLDKTTQERLRKAVSVLCETRHAKLSQAAQNVWCRALAQYATGEALWTAMRRLCSGKGKPSIDEIKEAMRGRAELKAWEPPKPLTDEEKAKSDQAMREAMALVLGRNT